MGAAATDVLLTHSANIDTRWLTNVVSGTIDDNDEAGVGPRSVHQCHIDLDLGTQITRETHHVTGALQGLSSALVKQTSGDRLGGRCNQQDPTLPCLDDRLDRFRDVPLRVGRVTIGEPRVAVITTGHGARAAAVADAVVGLPRYEESIIEPPISFQSPRPCRRLRSR